MEIFRFLKWWASKISSTAWSVFGAITAFITLIVSIVVFGPIAIGVFIILCLAAIVLLCIYLFVRNVCYRYEQYKEYKNNQVEMIVSRLRGHR